MRRTKLMKYTEYNEDAGRNEFGAHLESGSRNNSSLKFEYMATQP